MAREPGAGNQDSPNDRIAELERENAELRDRLAQSEQAARNAAIEQRRHASELKQSRAETEADLRRAKAQIARAEARHKRDREHDRSELASAEGIIAALETVQLAARDGEARMRALLRSASDYAVIETDLDGRITFWNSGAEALLGWTEERGGGPRRFDDLHARRP
jgi:PAS domain-containing protein